MSTLLTNNTLIKCNKFNAHKKDNIGRFKCINPTILLQIIIRNPIFDVLMSVYTTTEKIRKLLFKVDASNTSQSIDIKISAFDIHIKKWQRKKSNHNTFL